MENIVEVEKIQQTACTTILNYLVFLKDKSFADKAQNDLDEQIRKSKRH